MSRADSPRTPSCPSCGRRRAAGWLTSALPTQPASATREIGVTGRYDITQAWAKAFGPSGAQLLGVRYQPRFSTDARGWALGLFHDAGGASWPTDPHPHSGSTVAERLGIQVADLPTLSALSNALLVPPPPALP
jgi:hypothetical protein